MSEQEKKVVLPAIRFPEFSRCEVWKKRKLEKSLILALRKRNKPTVSYTGLGIRSHGKGTFLKNSVDPKKNAMEFLYSVKNKDLILSITFAWEGALAIADAVDEGALVSHRFPTYTFNEEVLLPDFFKYVILDKLFVYSLGVISPGGAGRNRVLNKKDFLTLSILQPDIAEQQKIADCLSSIDELVAAQSKKLESLKAHKKGLIQQLFPAEGKRVPKLRFPEFRRDRDWKSRKIEALAKRGSGHTPSKKNAEYYGGGIKWVSLGDSKKLDSGYIYNTAIEISQEGLNNSSAVLHPANSVIISRDAGVGKSAVLHEAMAVSQHFIAWQCEKGKLSNWFFYYFLQLMKPAFENIAVGNTIKTIGLPYFKELTIFIPSFAEQQQIANCLLSIDELITAQSQKIEALKAHKKGLMQQLFPTVDKVDT